VVLRESGCCEATRPTDRTTSVSKGRAASAASVLFNLPGFRVLQVVRDEAGGRTVTVKTLAVEGACPSCGVFTSAVHQRTLQRVRDVAFDGPVTVLWRKKRWRCYQSECARASFVEHTAQVRPRARLTTRLAVAVLAAVTMEVRAVEPVAVEYGLSWPTVARLLAAAAQALALGPVRLTRALGIDEHRFRSVRWFKDDAGSWRRVEPWSAGVHRPGHRCGPGGRGRPRRGRRARLATVSTSLVAAPRAGGRDRPLGGVPGRAASVAAKRQNLGRSLPLGEAGQRCGDRGAAALRLGVPRPSRPGGGPGVGAPPAPAARRRQPVGARLGQAQVHPVRG
jgi:hypothetical protein